MAHRRPFLNTIGPGLLVAATGVGAGDLATAAFTGMHLGTAVLWAVIAGAILKFVLTEGLARWQLATGKTLLEGAVHHLGRGVGGVFLAYLVFWSFFVGSALMSASGVALHAVFPVFDDPVQGKLVFGLLNSALGLILVLWGGFALFERMMKACVGVMFLTVVLTALLVAPDLTQIFKGILVPRIPDAGSKGIPWTVALIGGVGGTVTILCYGYWIREEGRVGPSDLTRCRIDLGVGYLVTAIFGLSMVIIGSTLSTDGSGAALIVACSEKLAEPLGVWGKWLFVVGAYAAIFSSLLGVWQAVPYLFADLYNLLRFGRGAAERVSRSPAYRGYLVALAVVPTLGLAFSFQEVQKWYAIVGAFFMPLLALLLLVLNGHQVWVGEMLRNRWPATLALFVTLGFFGAVAIQRLWG